MKTKFFFGFIVAFSICFCGARGILQRSCFQRAEKRILTASETAFEKNEQNEFSRSEKFNCFRGDASPYDDSPLVCDEFIRDLVEDNDDF
jgi:hypothetical protein